MKTIKYIRPNGEEIIYTVPDDAEEVREDKGVTPPVQEIWEIGNNLVMSDAEKRVAIGNILTNYSNTRKKVREDKGVKDIVEDFKEIYGDYMTGYFCCNGYECGCNGAEVDTEVCRWLRTTLTTYGNQRFEQGVRAERKRIVAKLNNPRLVEDNGDFDAITANEVWDKVFRQGIIDTILDNKQPI